MTLALDLDVARDPRIESERLYLRRLTAADVTPVYRGWMNAVAINRYLESRFQQHDLEALHAFVASMATDRLNLFTGIFLHAGDRHIGNIKLGPINVHHGHADIGLLIGEADCWGKGYASEAIGVLCDFAFARIGLHRVTAGAYVDNEASSRAFEKCGFVREGLLRSHWLVDGRFQDGVLLGKSNPGHTA